jgi:hypothetical protein
LKATLMAAQPMSPGRLWELWAEFVRELSASAKPPQFGGEWGGRLTLGCFPKVG